MTVPIYRANGSNLIPIVHTGQAVSLASFTTTNQQSANRVDIYAPAGNSAPIIVGDFQISNTTSRGGILLNPGDSYTLELITCLQIIFVNGTAGDSASINWWIGDRV